MPNNTTSYNVYFHNEYKNTINDGLRVPIDDRGLFSDKYRPFSMGSNDILWNKGSANKCVKEMYDLNGGTVSAEDQVDYDNGLMDIRTLGKYSYRNCLWGYKGDSRKRTPRDLNSFRGYPTADSKIIEFLEIEMNKDTDLTKNTMNESIYCASDTIPFQIRKEVGEVFPTSSGADYILISGVVRLTNKLPFDSIFLRLFQETYIEDFSTGLITDKMYSGDEMDSIDPITELYHLYNRDFLTKVECHSDGSGLNYYFRFYSEIVNSNLDNGIYEDRVIKIKLGYIRATSEINDGIHLSSLPTEGEVVELNVTWNGSKWESIVPT
jgi:hypothetical protein